MSLFDAGSLGSTPAPGIAEHPNMLYEAETAPRHRAISEGRHTPPHRIALTRFDRYPRNS